MSSLCNLSKKIWKINENYRNFWVSKFHNSWTSGWILIYISMLFFFFLLNWHFLEYNTFLNYENLSISKKVIFVFVSWNLLKSFVTTWQTIFMSLEIYLNYLEWNGNSFRVIRPWVALYTKIKRLSLYCH